MLGPCLLHSLDHPLLLQPQPPAEEQPAGKDRQSGLTQEPAMGFCFFWSIQGVAHTCSTINKVETGNAISGDLAWEQGFADLPRGTMETRSTSSRRPVWSLRMVLTIPVPTSCTAKHFLASESAGRPGRLTPCSRQDPSSRPQLTLSQPWSAHSMAQHGQALGLACIPGGRPPSKHTQAEIGKLSL